LLFQRWPDATPDTMKELLTRTATPLRNTTAAIQGRGELNVAAAMATAPLDPSELGRPAAAASRGIVNHPFSKSTGVGSLELARGTHHVVMDGVVLLGERDIMGAAWTGALTALLTRDLRMWSGNGSFNGNQWIGEGFTPDTVTAAGRAWGGRSWAGRSWAGRSWAGSLWSGRSWASRVWNGRSWAGQTWSAASWNGNSTYGAGQSQSQSQGMGTKARTGPTVYGSSAVPRHWSTASWR
jgi:serine protease AprX